MSKPSAAAAEPPRSSDTADLLRRAGDGDRQAEATLVARLRPAMFVFARRRLRGPDVDEFTQDAVLLLVEALRARRIEDPSALGSFALGICRNLSRDRARAAERRMELWKRFGPKEEEASDTLGNEGLFNRAVLEDCIAQLTQRARRVVRHAFVEGDSNPEIAKALELSEGNVRVIRHRALVQLRECLEKPLLWSPS